MSKAAEITKPKAADPVEQPPAKLPEINPDHCTVNATGFVYKELVVRLPKGFTADMLNSNPKAAWAKVQARGKALKKFDRVVVIACDESWMADAVVAEASMTSVTFAKPRIITLGERQDQLLEDENYRIEWNGRGYVVRRKSDSVVVTETAPTMALAERDLRNLYPKRA
jgi:hypothetical protein